MDRRELIYEHVTRLTRLLQTEQRTASRLVPVQLQALLYLSRCNRYSDSPSAVADYLEITKGTASQTLRVLEREGLIVKESVRNDRRSVRLVLTAQGKKLLAGNDVAPAFVSGIAALTDTEQERVQDDLNRLLASIQRAAGRRSFGVCRSCRYFTRSAGGFQCGLTGEPLSIADSEKICREHEPVAV